MSETVRAFFAAPIDAATRDRVVSLCSRLAESGAQVKWVEPENIHVTLLFLGEIAEGVVEEVAAAGKEVAAAVGPFEVSLRGVGAFPNLGRPGTLWVGVEAGADRLQDLNARLRKKLKPIDSVTLESRPYTPHLTLGRVRSDKNRSALVDSARKFADWTAGPTLVDEIHLFKSELTPTGPVYTSLATARLGAT